MREVNLGKGIPPERFSYRYDRYKVYAFSNQNIARFSTLLPTVKKVTPKYHTTRPTPSPEINLVPLILKNKYIKTH